MNRLGRRIARLIEASGPLSVADYMAICLFDPEDGYYTTRDPFGVAGDFITAPEISQMFGELVGIWFLESWQAIGRPMPLTIAEIGPGRGTMMKDILRTIGKLAPELKTGANVALVETSPRLVEVQRSTLGGLGCTVEWHGSLETIPPGPLLVACNELFDAIPFRQFIRHDGRWLERAVGVDAAGRLHFGTGAATLDPAAAPAASDGDGGIFEIAPARTALLAAIAARIAGHGGAGLFFDYGHLQSAVGDTFQAVRQHGREGVFDNPGEADLTSHVDFAALAAAARAEGLAVDLTTQGEFLLARGLLERAGRLGAKGDDAVRARLSSEVERLAGKEQMGDLFKVLSVRSAIPAPRPRIT